MGATSPRSLRLVDPSWWWEDWWQVLSPEAKLLYLFLWSSTEPSGILKPDLDSASLAIGPVTEAAKEIRSRFLPLSGGLCFARGYLDYHYSHLPTTMEYSSGLRQAWQSRGVWDEQGLMVILPSGMSRVLPNECDKKLDEIRRHFFPRSMRPSVPLAFPMTRLPSDTDLANAANAVATLEEQQQFDAIRLSYPGLKRGLKVELAVFCKHLDWRLAMPRLARAIAEQVQERDRRKGIGAFVPEWPHFSTWLNQRRWEEEWQDAAVEVGSRKRKINHTELALERLRKK